MDENRIITLREAARISGKSICALHWWVQSGFLKIAPRWGKENGDRVFLGDLVDCLRALDPRWKTGKRLPNRQPHDSAWYARHVERMRFRRSLHTEEQRRRTNDLSYQRKKRWRQRKREELKRNE